MKSFIPVCEPKIEDKEKKYVNECLDTGWISSSGRFIDEFESKWAKYCNRKYGIAVCNGTAALQIAVKALGIGPGDEVILPAFTIISCALAIIYNGGIPVLVDSDPDTWTISVKDIENKITEKTKAIMIVHIYGHPADMDPVIRLAKKYKLAVIEDAAEAHGALYQADRKSASPKWKPCGSMGTVSIFSFYANKPITTGEGGMVLTDDSKRAEKIRSLRNLCFLPERRFFHNEAGFNFRITNIQAALGLAQLERIKEIIIKKRWIGQEYTKRLKDIKLLQLPVEKSWAKNIYWMYGIVISEKSNINAFRFAELLKDKGIETRPFFLGMHEQGVFRKMGLFLNQKYPVCERLSKKGLYLPSGLALNERQITYISDVIHRILP